VTANINSISIGLQGLHLPKVAFPELFPLVSSFFSLLVIFIFLSFVLGPLPSQSEWDINDKQRASFLQKIQKFEFRKHTTFSLSLSLSLSLSRSR